MKTEGNILIVANPTSGRGRGQRTAEKVADLLRRQNRTVAIAFTQAKGDAERTVRELSSKNAANVNCVVACGGDGTIQEVVNGIMCLKNEARGSVPVLGLAPAGRCNDFTRVLGITTDPRQIAQTIIGGHTPAIDIGRVNDRYFCTVATMGVDAEVSSFVNNMKMPLTGTPAYIYGALRVLARYKPHTVRIESDFGVIEKPILLASSANTSTYGGAIPIAPNADPSDGLLDLCMIDSVSRWRAMTLLPAVMRARHVKLREVAFHKVRSMRITSEHPLDIWADGEWITKTPAQIQIEPAALQVCRPVSR